MHVTKLEEGFFEAYGNASSRGKYLSVVMSLKASQEPRYMLNKHPNSKPDLISEHFRLQPVVHRSVYVLANLSSCIGTSAWLSAELVRETVSNTHSKEPFIGAPLPTLVPASLGNLFISK